MDSITLIIADDHPIFRFGLESVLQPQEHIRLLAIADDGLKALSMIRKHRPQVAILDIEMPGMDGIKVCETILQEGIPTQLGLLTMYKERELYKKAVNIGVSGYLLKETAPMELVDCIGALARGEQYISADIGKALIDPGITIPPQIKTILDTLSNTEKKVLVLIARQLSSKDIARKLFVSEKTIENHRYNISKKLDLSGGQNTLLKFALEHKGYLFSE